MRSNRSIAAFAAVLVLAAGAAVYQFSGRETSEPSPEILALESTVSTGADTETMIITLESGEVHIELLPSIAPQHVERIKTLVSQGAYDGVVFHRVIDGFMAQTGDVQYGDATDAGFNLRRAGTGGSDMPDLPAEFSTTPFERGTVGMARSQDPNSGNSQFFIMFDEGSFLNGEYTVFGRVVQGMEHVDSIKKGDRASNGAVDDPDRMVSVRMVN
ncbi:MAG: peptidylprolyl isomerase [Pseudomonadota bacterium]